jgi:hypothetical protein
LEIQGLKVALEQLRDAFVVLYSLLVVATILPGFAFFPNVLVLPYFLFVPGYFVTIIFHDTATLMEWLFYTFAWSIAIFVSVYAISTVVAGAVFPPTVIVPAVTILLMVYVHFHGTRRTA